MEVQQHHLGKKMEVDPGVATTEPSRNAALFKLVHCSKTPQSQNSNSGNNTSKRTSSRAKWPQEMQTCIDDDLTAIVDRESDSKHPMTYSVGNRPSTMGILEKHFDSLHPVHVRLNKMVSLFPSTNQTMAGFYEEFIKVANKANAKNMPSSQLIVVLMTSRCPDENLKMQLLKESLTMDQVYDKAQQHLSARKTMGSNQEAAATSTKCYSCNSSGHQPDN